MAARTHTHKHTHTHTRKCIQLNLKTIIVITRRSNAHCEARHSHQRSPAVCFERSKLRWEVPPHFSHLALPFRPANNQTNPTNKQTRREVIMLRAPPTTSDSQIKSRQLIIDENLHDGARTLEMLNNPARCHRASRRVNVYQSNREMALVAAGASPARSTANINRGSRDGSQNRTNAIQRPCPHQSP